MSLFPSPSGSFINTVSPQADSNGDGVPSQQDHLPSTLAILDTLRTSPQISPSTDDLSAMSSVSPWDIDALPIANDHPDSHNHDVMLTDLPEMGFHAGQDTSVGFPPWDTS